jgi:hypothetical protein
LDAGAIASHRAEARFEVRAVEGREREHQTDRKVEAGGGCGGYLGSRDLSADAIRDNKKPNGTRERTKVRGELGLFNEDVKEIILPHSLQALFASIAKLPDVPMIVGCRWQWMEATGSQPEMRQTLFYVARWMGRVQV